MLFYWLILAVKKFIWLFRLPQAEQFAMRDQNAKCPVCGWMQGELRCVILQRPGPTAQNMPPPLQVLCQHRCGRCGGRWHEEPIAKLKVTEVLASVARNKIELREDLGQRLTQPSK